MGALGGKKEESDGERDSPPAAQETPAARVQPGRRRRSPAFGTQPSCEMTPTYSSSFILLLLLGL